MTKTKPATKQIIMQIDNVRIREHDSYNLAVERYEEYYNPVEKKQSAGYRFKGYASNVLGALKLIMNKQLLVDEKEAGSLAEHLERVQESNDYVMQELEAMK